MEKEIFGHLLVELRKKQHISQRDLANYLLVSPSTLCKWERGQNMPDVTTLKKLAERLDVTVDSLLNPEETLMRLHETSQSNTPVPISTSTPHKKVMILISVFILISITFLCIFIFRPHKPSFEIITFREIPDGPYGESYHMAILYHNTTQDDCDNYCDIIYKNWMNGNYSSTAVTLSLYFYSNRKAANNWFEPDSLVTLVRQNIPEEQ